MADDLPPRLWHVTVTLDLEFPVVAPNAETARKVAQESWQDEVRNYFDDDAHVGMASEITDLSLVDPDWAASMPYGLAHGDYRSCADVLAAGPKREPSPREKQMLELRERLAKATKDASPPPA